MTVARTDAGFMDSIPGMSREYGVVDQYGLVAGEATVWAANCKDAGNALWERIAQAKRSGKSWWCMPIRAIAEETSSTVRPMDIEALRDGREATAPSRTYIITVTATGWQVGEAVASSVDTAVGMWVNYFGRARGYEIDDISASPIGE